MCHAPGLQAGASLPLTNNRLPAKIARVLSERERGMSNIGVLLKEEIRRLARRECRALNANLRRDNARLKRTAAEHKRRLAALEQDNRRLVAEADARFQEADKATPEEIASARIGSSRIKALRKRLRRTQAEFGRLLGVSSHTVFQWENKPGRLNLRARTKAAIVAARKLSARDAQRKLELMAPKPAAKKRKGSRKRQGRRATIARA